MKKDYDFKQIGKRMPYTMPEGFLKQVEENVLKEIAVSTKLERKEKRNTTYVMFRSAIAAAAVATLLITSYKTMLSHTRETSYQDIEQAFDNLSYDDQEYMLDTNSEDIFLASSDYQ